jgi:glutamine amidotransferase PdxT
MSYAVTKEDLCEATQHMLDFLQNQKVTESEHLMKLNGLVVPITESTQIEVSIRPSNLATLATTIS